MGTTEFTQRDKRTGEVEIIAAELFYDVDEPMLRFVELDGVPGRHSLNLSRTRVQPDACADEAHRAEIETLERPHSVGRR